MATVRSMPLSRSMAAICSSRHSCGVRAQMPGGSSSCWSTGDGILQILKRESGGEMLGDFFQGIADVAFIIDPIDRARCRRGGCDPGSPPNPIAASVLPGAMHRGRRCWPWRPFWHRARRWRRFGPIEKTEILLVAQILFDFTIANFVGLAVILRGGFRGLKNFLRDSGNGGQVGGGIKFRIAAIQGGIGLHFLFDAFFHAISGNWRISIDWIMRGASFIRCSSRMYCDVSNLISRNTLR